MPERTSWNIQIGQAAAHRLGGETLASKLRHYLPATLSFLPSTVLPSLLLFFNYFRIAILFLAITRRNGVSRYEAGDLRCGSEVYQA